MGFKEKLKKLKDEGYEAVAKETKEDIDDALNEYVNVPLAEKGYPKIGAGISAGLSSAADYVIPDTKEQVAMMAAGPIVGKMGKALKMMQAESKIPGKLAKAEEAVADARKVEKVTTEGIPSAIANQRGDKIVKESMSKMPEKTINYNDFKKAKPPEVVAKIKDLYTQKEAMQKKMQTKYDRSDEKTLGLIERQIKDLEK